jgi:hypothetical protein
VVAGESTVSDSVLEDLQRIARRRHFWPHPVRHPIAWAKTRYRNTKYGLQRAMRGYSDCDTWNAGEAIAAFALPILRKYRDNGPCGVPWGLIDGLDPVDGYGERWPEAEAIWRSIVERSISALEIVAEERELYMDDAPSNPTEEELEAWSAEVDRRLAQWREDLRLFGEWLPAMWD